MINLGPALIIIKDNGLPPKCTANAQWRPMEGGNGTRLLTHLRDSGCPLFTFSASSPYEDLTPNNEQSLGVGKAEAGDLGARLGL